MKTCISHTYFTAVANWTSLPHPLHGTRPIAAPFRDVLKGLCSMVGKTCHISSLNDVIDLSMTSWQTTKLRSDWLFAMTSWFHDVMANLCHGDMAKSMTLFNDDLWHILPTIEHRPFSASRNGAAMGRVPWRGWGSNVQMASEVKCVCEIHVFIVFMIHFDK